MYRRSQCSQMISLHGMHHYDPARGVFWKCTIRMDIGGFGFPNWVRASEYPRHGARRSLLDFMLRSICTSIKSGGRKEETHTP